jgi:HAD superfamily hydrolase (TIGR01549 family)
MKDLTQAILFDFDGTLADTLPYYVKAYNETLHSFGFALSNEEIVKRCFGKRETDICISLGIPQKASDFTKVYVQKIKELFIEVQLFDDTIKTLEFLKTRGIRMGIVTFQYRWYIDIMLNRLNLKSYFDITLTVDDVLHPKPNPEAITKACSFFDLEPARVMMVGDAKSDVNMAKAAGSTSVLFCPSVNSLFYNQEELKNTHPDFTISNLKELIQLVR